MDKITIQLPAIVNNVPVTNDLLVAIDMLQTGGDIHTDYCKKEYNPIALTEKLDDCKELIVYFAGIITRGDSTTDNREELDFISRLYWLHDLLKNFKTPSELFLK